MNERNLAAPLVRVVAGELGLSQAITDLVTGLDQAIPT